MKHIKLIILLIIPVLEAQAQLKVSFPVNFGTPVCGKYGYKFNFNTTGDSRANDNTFRVKLVKSTFPNDGSIIPASDIVDQSDLVGAYVSGSGGSYVRSAEYYIDSKVITGTYRLYVFSDIVATNSASSNIVTVNATPVATISGGGTILYGQSVPVKVSITGGGSWSFKYNTLTSTSATNFVAVTNTNTNPYTFTIPATQTYYYSSADISDVKNGTCDYGDVNGSASIVVTPLTVTPTSVNSATICPGRDPISVGFTINGSAPAGSTYAAQISDINGSFTNPTVIGTGSASPIVSDPVKLASFTPSPNYRVRVVPTNNTTVLQAATTSVAITLARSPRPIVTPITYCDNAILPLQVSGSSLFWYGISTDNGLTFIGYDKAATPPSPTSPGTYIYQVTQTLNGCQSELANLNVTVKAKSVPPGVSSKEYCLGETPSPLTASGQNLIWYDGNGTQLAQAPTPPTNSATTLTYKVSQDNGNGCRSDQAIITVKIKERPGPPAVTNPAAVCQLGDAAVLVASASSGGNLSWFGPDGAALTGAPKPNTQNAGTFTYTVSQNVNGCESATKSTISQVVKPASATPTVTSPISLCRGKTVGTAISAAVTGESLTWYDGGTSSSVAPVPNTDVARMITYQVKQTQTANGCPSAPVDVVVNIRDAPQQPTVVNLGLCQGGPSTTLTAGGDNLLWYTAATGGPPIATPVPSTTQTGDQTYYVSQSFGTGAGACESPTRAALKVTINPIPDNPTIKQPNAVCQYVKLDNTGTAAAVTGNNQNLKWYVTPQSTSSPTAPAPATDLDGPQSFSVTQTVNGCESQRATVTITVNKAPTPPGSAAATDLLRCSSDSPRSLSATAATGSKLYWYSQASAGNILPALASALPAAPTLPDPAVTVAPNTTKVYVYYVTQVDGNGCQSLQQPISATIAGTPTAPAVTAQLAVCQNIKPQALTASVLSGATLYWNGPNVATDSQTAPTPPTNTTAVLTYTVRQQIGSCKSPTSTISYTVRPLPSAPTVQSPRTACINSPAFSLSAMGQNLKWYTDTVSKANPQTQVPVSTNTASTKTWFVSQTDVNNCESAFTPLVVRVLAQATARLYGDEKIDLYDSTAVRIQFGGEGPWSATLMGSTLRADSVIKVITKTLINPTVVWVRPKLLTTTYTLTGLINDCGTGAQPNTYLITAKTPTAVNPVGPAVFLTASPNPASNLIQVDWAYANNTNVTLRVLSATGSVLWQTDRVGTSTTQTESIRAGNWPAGLYILQLQAESGGMLTRKLVKQ